MAAGYEVHLNFSPVIIADGWENEYAALLLDPAAKAQLACEVIFLTHNADLHTVNMGWHPKAETQLWRPDQQETKISNTGGENVRYRHGYKGQLPSTLRALLHRHLPYCPVRYAF